MSVSTLYKNGKEDYYLHVNENLPGLYQVESYSIGTTPNAAGNYPVTVSFNVIISQGPNSEIRTNSTKVVDLNELPFDLKKPITIDVILEDLSGRVTITGGGQLSQNDAINVSRPGGF